MQAVDFDVYLQALLAAPRPGAEKILAFYEARVGHICTDPRLLLLPLDDHLCHRGDGLFESLCYRGGKIFALEVHLARFRQGASALTLEPPCSWDELRARILDVCRASGTDHGDVRVFLSRGPGGFGVAPGECPTAGLYIVALKKPLPETALYSRGYTAFTSAIPPKQEYLARIKNTNYLPNVFMACEASQKGMDVAVTFDENGVMGEAAVANVGIVDKDGVLRSPELNRVLAGTTLLEAMRLASARMPAQYGPIGKGDIRQAREMLLFTSSTLCVALTHFDGHPVGQGENVGKPGPVALWLKDALLERMLAEGVPF